MAVKFLARGSGSSLLLGPPPSMALLVAASEEDFHSVFASTSQVGQRHATAARTGEDQAKTLLLACCCYQERSEEGDLWQLSVSEFELEKSRQAHRLFLFPGQGRKCLKS